MRLNKDYVRYVNYWVIVFYNNKIIENYTMLKKDARDMFNRLREDKSKSFEELLAGLNICKIVYSTKKKPIIIFNAEKLDDLLKHTTVTQPAIKKKLNNKIKKKSNNCDTCSICFPNEQDLQEHKDKDQGHYIRELYFTKSKLLESTSNDISIEINQGSGCGREVLLLNCDTRTTSMISVQNISNNTYNLTDIVEVNPYITDIVIYNINSLPISFPPNTESQFSIDSFVTQPLTSLLVLVFVFKNKKRKKTLFLCKEITIHVTSETYHDLNAKSKYVKPIRKQNDIDTSDYVAVDLPVPVSNNKVELFPYQIPFTLKTLLMAKLQTFDGITSDELKQLRTIEKLLNDNSSGLYLTKNNYFKLLDLLIHMEEYQLSVDIRNYDTETKDLIKMKGYNHRYQLSVPDLAERRPSLLPGDSVYVKSAKSKTYQGVVRLVQQDSVILEFNRQFSDKVYIKGINLSVTYGYNRSIIRCEHRAVALLKEHAVIEPFFPSSIPVVNIPSYRLQWFNRKIESNSEQQQAILHILHRTSYPSPYLIFGPPGTGKTMTIVESISQVWKTKPTAKILVCAPSNSVANEIAKRLTEYVPKSELFRYISVSFDMYTIPDEVLPFTNYYCGEFYQPTLAEACDYRIIISTLSNAPRLVSLGVPPGHFSYVFIDESGHATESETLLPIAGLLTSKKQPGAVLGQIVLAGDPKQLGPIIHSPYARQYGFGTSMLERLMTTIDAYKRKPSGTYNPKILTKLLNNYRSHPSILHLPNRMFYDEELVAKGDQLVNIALNWDKLPNKEVPIIFHSVLGSDQREANSPSYFNVQEIEIVMKYLSDLISNRLKGRLIKQEDIGVIAPYRKQVQKIRKACEKKNWNELTIGSVEQFQGQERLIIIVSTVRSKPNLLEFDNKFHLGFLNNPKRFNVALTRAKALVIVVGNPNLLQYETYWRTFIQYCINNKCMTGAPFNFTHNATDSLALDMAKMRIDGEAEDTADFSRGNI